MHSSYGAYFGFVQERIWFNCAHQGPLPLVAVEAAQEAIRQKTTPHLIRDEDFIVVPRELKASLARLINTEPNEVILGNSASYGLHVLRNGLSWKAGDEVLVEEGDFPATVYPWLGLEEQGVCVRRLRPRGNSLTSDEVAGAITPSTRVLAISWVNSFNGGALDLEAIGRVCRQRGIIFVVNGSQGIGTLRLDVQSIPIDALVCCGYKWLCGPYGTGFCWIRPKLRSELRASQTYWLPHVWGQENLTDYRLKAGLGSAAFDVFCTANFLNFLPWHASLNLLLRIGISAIEEHNRALSLELISGLDHSKYLLMSPSEEAARSAIVVLSHHEKRRNREIHNLLAQSGIDIGFRAENLRFSLHLYNNSGEIERALQILNSIT